MITHSELQEEDSKLTVGRVESVESFCCRNEDALRKVKKEGKEDSSQLKVTED